jgi:GTP-binding protein
MFVDVVEIEVQAGRGGNGVVSFRREKYVPKGGPDGGDGGRGGDVILQVDDNLMTLMDLKYRRTYRASNGGDGEGGQRSGKGGDDTIVRVPPGTAIFDADEPETLIVDLTKPGETHVIATGGRGGKGNVHFKSSTNQSPRKATGGRPGESKRLKLELRLIADVGLVGYPNAGKSTILAAMSDAKPKIASYPFTTLSPNLGIVKLDNYKEFRMADIPGIIEGASKGKGLGLQFLRHIMRTRVLLFVVDVSEGDPLETLSLLRKELGDFDWRLNEKPFLIALNKIDLVSDERTGEIGESVGRDWVATSGLTSLGIQDLRHALAGKLGL